MSDLGKRSVSPIPLRRKPACRSRCNRAARDRRRQDPAGLAAARHEPQASIAAGKSRRARARAGALPAHFAASASSCSVSSSGLSAFSTGPVPSQRRAVPRRRASARRAVGRGERCLSRPADAAVSAGHLLQDRWRGDSRRLAVGGQVHAGKLEIVQAGFDARLRGLRVPGPLVKQRSPSCHTAPIPRRAGARRAGPCQGGGRERGAEPVGDDRIALVPDAVERSKTRCPRT
jgi:hypothetical protein